MYVSGWLEDLQTQGGNIAQGLLQQNPTTDAMLQKIEERVKAGVASEAGKNAAALFALSIAGGGLGGYAFGKAGPAGLVLAGVVAVIAGAYIYQSSVTAAGAATQG